jgi:hypothetical protein
VGTTRTYSIKRILELTHTSFSHLPLRHIVQFQYLDWPNLNVPGDVAYLSSFKWLSARSTLARKAADHGKVLIGTVHP